jgi:hypothetical protein
MYKENDFAMNEVSDICGDLWCVSFRIWTCRLPFFCNEKDALNGSKDYDEKRRVFR